MLTLYRRHLKTGFGPKKDQPCPHTEDRFYRRCSCPVWIEGVHNDRYRRESLKVDSWARAEEMKQDILNPKTEDSSITFKEASDLYIAELEARRWKPVTIRKMKLIVKAIEETGPKFLKDIDAKFLIKLRSSWNEHAPITQQKETERLRSMFKWFVDTDLIEKSPAKGLRVSGVFDTAVEPFSPDEQAKIIAMAYRLSRTGEHKPKQSPVNPKTGTFANLLLYSALRITDAAMLTKDRIQGQRLFLYATKNKRVVSVPLPPDLIAELRAIPSDPLFPSPEGSKRGETVSDFWRDQLIKVFDWAEIQGGHPHRFRHSLAVNMLDKGSSVEDVALVLGNSPAVVMKHYAAYVESRQKRIDQEVTKTWPKSQLQLVG